MSNFAQDMVVKTAWGYTLPQWERLSPKQQAYCRENVTTAPNFEVIR
jgi:hypothetical protein